ncbi:ribosomal protein S18-alanine N-acetyltransferase [Radiobacillus kanasensis]|uniref:ribosomal protein S18-alanine N-acetyltransferase n=1 Tax=Radiobacillus kanasensis TaxID=2844358 RepID=UPI001E50D398|nr:ribosomal protein S18-alanine N-acetyltransferase [Radiobacillus kanasensis]UFT99836.1 ribosomal protein S18-alanine N-acetyltransferase [Radiobacillus kanasensis]
MTEAVIRKMVLEDIDQVVDIEQQSFATPWPRDIFFNELTNNQYANYFVVEVDGLVVGYCGLWVVIDDAQITNIAILPSHRGQSYGKALFQHVMHKATALGALRLSLEVRLSNTVAQRMYRSFGLVPGGIRKSYYTDNNEDALVMWVNLR